MTLLRTNFVYSGARTFVARPRGTAQVVSRVDAQHIRSAGVGILRSKRQCVMMNATTEVSVDELHGLCMSSLETIGYTRDEASVLTEVRPPFQHHFDNMNSC